MTRSGPLCGPVAHHFMVGEMDCDDGADGTSAAHKCDTSPLVVGLNLWEMTYSRPEGVVY